VFEAKNKSADLWLSVLKLLGAEWIEIIESLHKLHTGPFKDGFKTAGILQATYVLLLHVVMIYIQYKYITHLA